MNILCRPLYYTLGVSVSEKIISRSVIYFNPLGIITGVIITSTKQNVERFIAVSVLSLNSKDAVRVMLVVVIVIKL